MGGNLHEEGKLHEKNSRKIPLVLVLVLRFTQKNIRILLAMRKIYAYPVTGAASDA